MPESEWNRIIFGLNEKKEEIFNEIDSLSQEIQSLQVIIILPLGHFFKQLKYQFSKKEDEEKRVKKFDLDQKLKDILKSLDQTNIELEKVKKEKLFLKQRRDELERKSQIKSDEQLKVEALLNSEEKLKSIINERDLTISQQEKAISDLKLKLQVKINLKLKFVKIHLKRKKVVSN